MVCLCHFENPELYTSSWENNVCYFMDSTDTCLIKIMAQADINSSIAKFGNWSLFRNYLIPGGNGGITVYELPEMDEFTLEMWQIAKGAGNQYAAGGYVIYLPSYNSLPEATLSGTNWGYYTGLEWTHCAWVRRSGTGIVEEYINGQKVGEIPFTAKIGGRPTCIYGRGNSSSNQGVYSDEIAIFNYAKYTENFEPPTTPYNDEISGLNQNNNPAREVSVSGHSIRFINDKSFALIDSSATGTSRKWSTIDGKYFIVFDNMNWWCWIITNVKDPMVNPDYVEYARLTAAGMDIEPIGTEGWIDSFTQEPINVTNN